MHKSTHKTLENFHDKQKLTKMKHNFKTDHEIKDNEI